MSNMQLGAISLGDDVVAFDAERTPLPPSPRRVRAEARSVETAEAPAVRGWLSRLVSLYAGSGEVDPRRTTRVAPGLGVGAVVEATLSSACTIEIATDDPLTGQRTVKRGRISPTVLRERWPDGGFVRGVVEAVDAGGYSVRYADGPYAFSEPTAPPPGYPISVVDDADAVEPPETKTCCCPRRGMMDDGVCVVRGMIAFQPREGFSASSQRKVRLLQVPVAQLVANTARDASHRRIHRPWGIVLMTLAQVLAFAWWRHVGRVNWHADRGIALHRYVAASGTARTKRSADAPGPPALFYRRVGKWSGCEDLRPEAWRLLSYQFVHVSWSHVIANALMQLIFGIPIELTHGTLTLLVIYQLGVLSGGLVCSVADSYAVVVGASGGTYTLLGAHLGAIYKDWDRLKSGTLNRWTRLGIFALLFAVDVTSWALTRASDVSYSAHLGGAATGLLLGVLALRRRRSRSAKSMLKRLRRPAFALAALVYVSTLIFGASWHFAVWPPKPISRMWYDQPKGHEHRPCCFQLFACGKDIRRGIGSDFDDLRCEYDRKDDEYLLLPRDGSDPDGIQGCEAIRAWQDDQSRR